MKICKDCGHVVLRPAAPINSCFKCSGVLEGPDEPLKKKSLGEQLSEFACQALGGKIRRKKDRRKLPMDIQITASDVNKRINKKKPVKTSVLAAHRKAQRTASAATKRRWTDEKGWIRKPGGF